MLQAPKSWLNNFFQPFSTFFVNFKPFSVISRLKSTKKSENEQKSYICLLLKAGRHAKAGQLPDGVSKICLFWLIFLPLLVGVISIILFKLLQVVFTSYYSIGGYVNQL